MLKCCLPRLNRVVNTLVVLVAIAVLNGCGGGGGGSASSSTPTPTVTNADPTGYYDVTGTATVDNGPGSTLNITDLQGMVSGNHFILISVAHDIVYDGTINSVTGNNFTASATVYNTGVVISATSARYSSASSVSGTITQGSSISGTMTGSGPGNGTFTLTYGKMNNQAAMISNVKNNVSEEWSSLIGGSTTMSIGFIVDSSGTITWNSGETPADGEFQSCQISSGTITPVSGQSFYAVAITLSNCFAAAANGDYAGFAKSLSQSSANDTLVLVATNSTYSFDAAFKRKPL